MSSSIPAQPSLEPLAIDGGRPVRDRPLPSSYLGASLLGDEELELLTEVVRSRSPFREYGDGAPHMVRDLEARAREYFGVPHALATATGSGAFLCALAGLGIGPGDEVIIPSFGWHTNFHAPALMGATPVFCDIDESLCMDPRDLQRRITPRTRVIMVVHFQGATGDLSAIAQLAQRHGIFLFEDCAQATGATYHGKKLGSFGDVACISLQQNKIITTGDGGLLLVQNPRVFERAARFHDLGMVRPSLHVQYGSQDLDGPFCGGQWRMNEFSGAVALAQLAKLDTRILAPTRRYHAMLRERLAQEAPQIRLRPVSDPQGDAGIAFFMNMPSADRATWFASALKAEGIRVGAPSSCMNLLHHPVVREKRMVHPALPPFGPGCAGEHVNYEPALCPNTDGILSRQVCVALSPTMTDHDVRDVGDAIVKIASRMARG